MKRKIAALILVATIGLTFFLIPAIRQQQYAYFFDYRFGGLTIMLPRCETTDNHEGCAHSLATAILTAELRALHTYIHMKTGE